MEEAKNLFFPNKGHRLVVLDDDPTGIQTVQGCLVLTVWDDIYLRMVFNDEIPFFYVLTNTRALTRNEVGRRITEVVSQIVKISLEMDRQVTFLLRSDSTLRGHFPLEIETVLEVAKLKTNARFFVPALFEGGRITENNNQYLFQEGKKIPCDQTEFAQDSVFGYTTSYLPEYIKEKTSEQIKPESILNIDRKLLDGNHEMQLDDFIASLIGDHYVIVNATDYKELDRFGISLKKAINNGSTFIIQSSSSLVKSLTGCNTRNYCVRNTSLGPGLIIIGSHVNKTTRQLGHLFREANGLKPIEIDVFRLFENEELLLLEVKQLLKSFMGSRITPVIFTSRTEIAFDDRQSRMEAGLKISSFLNEIVATCPFQPSFCISKGGITSNEILSKGLGVHMARVIGQASPGVPIIEMPLEHRWPTMPYVIFPGNVGEESTLTEVYQLLTGT